LRKIYGLDITSVLRTGSKTGIVTFIAIRTYGQSFYDRPEQPEEEMNITYNNEQFVLGAVHLSIIKTFTGQNMCMASDEQKTYPTVPECRSSSAKPNRLTGCVRISV
jgi:hypothetical protein